MGLDQIVEVQDGLVEARHLISNLEETHMKMREILKIKLDEYLDQLL